MKPRSIKNLLSEFLNGKDFKAINDTISLTAAWKQNVGDPISKNTEIIDFKNGKLIIKTSNPIWRNELSFQKNELLNKLKKAEPGLNITEIIFIIIKLRTSHIVNIVVKYTFWIIKKLIKRHFLIKIFTMFLKV